MLWEESELGVQPCCQLVAGREETVDDGSDLRFNGFIVVY